MVERIKKAIEPFYKDSCTVYEKYAVSEGGRTGFKEVLKYSDVPCRMSAKAYLFGENAASEGDNTLRVGKKVKLFLPPEFMIAPGSRIEVISHGRALSYGKSGEMSCYESHNEVMIELLKDYA